MTVSIGSEIQETCRQASNESSIYECEFPNPPRNISNCQIHKVLTLVPFNSKPTCMHRHSSNEPLNLTCRNGRCPLLPFKAIDLHRDTLTQGRYVALRKIQLCRMCSCEKDLTLEKRELCGKHIRRRVVVWNSFPERYEVVQIHYQKDWYCSYERDFTTTIGKSWYIFLNSLHVNGSNTGLTRCQCSNLTDGRKILKMNHISIFADSTLKFQLFYVSRTHTCRKFAFTTLGVFCNLGELLSKKVCPF